MRLAAWCVLVGLGLGSNLAFAGRGRPAPAASVLASMAPSVPAPPPAPVLPRLPGAVSPLDASVIRPDLSCHDVSLDVTSMTRRMVWYDIAFDRAPLDAVDAHKGAALLELLAADPRWRVGEEHGVPVAWLRAQDATGAWVVPAGGYHVVTDGVWRADVRLGAWPAASPWAVSSWARRPEAGASKVTLDAWVMSDPNLRGLRGTVMVIDAAGVGVDVFEADTAAVRGRPYTVAGLSAAQRVIGTAVASADQIHASGSRAMALPVGEPALVGALSVSSPAAGQLDVRARVNPGARGWVWVRVMAGGTVWEEAAVGSGTRERVGWSTDPARGFWAQSAFPVPAGPAFDATAEVWFAPDDGGTVRKLMSVPVTVPAR